MGINNVNTKKHPEIAALILAAGYSSRMEAFKALMPIGNKTAVKRIIDSVREAGVDKIILVTGFQREALLPVIENEKIQESYNPKFDEGMLTSVQSGLFEATRNHTDLLTGVFLMLVDSPLVSADVLEAILEKHRNHPDCFIVPCYFGKKGHPLLIPACFVEEILNYRGEGGLKAIIGKHEEKMIRLELNHEEVVFDMDTKEDYEAILNYFIQSIPGQPQALDVRVRELMTGKRLILVRHGEIRQHSGKIFLGQADIPLSEKGKKQAEETGSALRKMGLDLSSIYSSDLKRATETGEIIQSVLGEEIPIVMKSGFREMALGEWDGKLIEEIRNNYPEEYRRRGGNLISWKQGNDSENYYDLQYRVATELKKTLSENEKDILVVTHSGVIKVISSLLSGNSLLEELNGKPENGSITVFDYRLKEKK